MLRVQRLKSLPENSARLVARRVVDVIRFRENRVPVDPLFVLATPRTGSTFLVECINSLSDAAIRGEVLHPDKLLLTGSLERRSTTALRQIRRGLGADRAQIRGAKILLDQLADRHLSVEELLADYPQARIILLWRRHLGAQYVSHRLGQISGVWHRRTGARKAPPPQMIELSANEYRVWKSETLEMYNAAMPTLSASPERTLMLEYEDVSADPVGCMRQVAHFLGVPPARPYSSLRKLGTRPLDERVSNYQELAQLLQEEMRFTGVRFESQSH